MPSTAALARVAGVALDRRSPASTPVASGRFGVSVCDYDNDGWPDIYVSNFGTNRLYHNNHDGTFTHVAD